MHATPGACPATTRPTFWRPSRYSAGVERWTHFVQRWLQISSWIFCATSTLDAQTLASSSLTWAEVRNLLRKVSILIALTRWPSSLTLHSKPRGLSIGDYVIWGSEMSVENRVRISKTSSTWNTISGNCFHITSGSPAHQPNHVGRTPGN
jgi:hypothetical protein